MEDYSGDKMLGDYPSYVDKGKEALELIQYKVALDEALQYILGGGIYVGEWKNSFLSTTIPQEWVRAAIRIRES